MHVPFEIDTFTERADQKHRSWMLTARAQSALATCVRRKVGCVLVDRAGMVMSTGYNGTPRGQRHCTSVPCAGASCEPGTGLDLCEAIHAEQNALIQCRDHLSIEAAYVTAFPCMHCVKMLLNTSCQSIYYAEPYAHDKAVDVWTMANRRSFLLRV